MIDIDAYCHRTGIEGPLRPDLPTLRALVAAHGCAIAFENLEPLAQRVPALELDSLQAKLVARRRGGYCFEQNTLFEAVLAAVGFDVRTREARVRAGVPAEAVTGRTHMALEVQLEGRAWLVDVGFGALGPLAPLALDEAGEQVARTGRYRLVPGARGQLLQSLAHDGWRDAYEVLDSRPEPIDRVIANWYVATHPQAFLRRNLVVSRGVPGGRLQLFNRTLARLVPEASVPEVQAIDSLADLEDTLAGDFGIVLAASELEAAWRVALSAPPGPM